MYHSHRSSPTSLTRRRIVTAAVFVLFVWAPFVLPSTWNRPGTRGWLTLQSFSDGALGAAWRSGVGEPTSGYKVLASISHGNLTIFPVIADFSHDTSRFLTLDEGLRSGEVVVTEAGKIQPLIRRPSRPIVQYGDQVNQLVLVNNSDRPLILLAGEIVTGGKQDRVVGKDRIVPAESDPVDLGVFCVEPHRWVERSTKFDTHASVMAQPSVRKKAMVEKDQQQVWNEVNNAKSNMSANARAAAPPPASAGAAEYSLYLGRLESDSSYAGARENKVVEKQVQAITE